MGWICFRDMAELVEHSDHGCEPSPIAKTTHTASLHFCQKWNATVLIKPQSGTMCPRCESLISQCLPMLSPVDGRARGTVLQGLSEAWTTSEADWRANCYDLFALLDRNSVSWKTSQASLFPVSDESPQNYPWQGMWDDTGFWPVTTWARPGMNASECGSPLPTPTTFDTGNRVNKSQSKNAATRPLLGAMARRGLLPTPVAVAVDGTKGSSFKQRNGQMQWSLANMARKGLLPTATATARDWKDGCNPSRHGSHSPSLPLRLAQLGLKGYLNPRFVEKMMGLPNGATKLKPWAAELFRKLREKRSKD